VHDGTELTILQAVMHLMGVKSKYNFSNQCHNDIVMLIIDLIPAKHNMPKDLYQSKKIVASLGMTTRRLMCAKGIVCCSGRSTMMILNVCIAVGADT
jgi:hypothetical protein